MDSNGKILDYNIGQLSPLSVLPDAFIGKRIQDIFPANVSQKFSDSIIQVLQKDTLIGIEYSLPVKNGERSYEARLISLNQREIIAIIRDITERKQVVDDLRDSEERYRTLVESATDAVFTLNEQGILLSVNQAIARIIGMNAKDMIGKNIYSFFSIDTADELVQALHSVFLTGNPAYTSKMAIQTLSGKRWFNIILSPVRDKRRQIVHVLGIARNVTEQIKSQEALTESEERFRLLVEHAWDAFYLHDHNGKIFDVNQRACESLGYSQKELLELSIQDIEQDFNSSNMQQIWQELKPGIAETILGTYKRKDGSLFPVEIRFGLVKQDKKQLILSIARSTEEKTEDRSRK